MADNIKDTINKAAGEKGLSTEAKGLVAGWLDSMEKGGLVTTLDQWVEAAGHKKDEAYNAAKNFVETDATAKKVTEAVGKTWKSIGGAVEAAASAAKDGAGKVVDTATDVAEDLDERAGGNLSKNKFGLMGMIGGALLGMMFGGGIGGLLIGLLLGGLIASFMGDKDGLLNGLIGGGAPAPTPGGTTPEVEAPAPGKDREREKGGAGADRETSPEKPKEDEKGKTEEEKKREEAAVDDAKAREEKAKAEALAAERKAAAEKAAAEKAAAEKAAAEKAAAEKAAAEKAERHTIVSPKNTGADTSITLDKEGLAKTPEGRVAAGDLKLHGTFTRGSFIIEGGSLSETEGKEGDRFKLKEPITLPLNADGKLDLTANANAQAIASVRQAGEQFNIAREAASKEAELQRQAAQMAARKKELGLQPEFISRQNTKDGVMFDMTYVDDKGEQQTRTITGELQRNAPVGRARATYDIVIKAVESQGPDGTIISHDVPSGARIKNVPTHNGDGIDFENIKNETARSGGRGIQRSTERVTEEDPVIAQLTDTLNRSKVDSMSIPAPTATPTGDLAAVRGAGTGK